MLDTKNKSLSFFFSFYFYFFWRREFGRWERSSRARMVHVGRGIWQIAAAALWRHLVSRPRPQCVDLAISSAPSLAIPWCRCRRRPPFSTPLVRSPPHAALLLLTFPSSFYSFVTFLYTASIPRPSMQNCWQLRPLTRLHPPSHI